MHQASRLVINCHPVPGSLSRALFSAAIEALTSPDGEPPNHVSLSDGDDPTIEDLQGVTTLVFVYPTWWGGPPAGLLDWVQRMFGPWVDGSTSAPSPIAAVETLAVVTTHGSPSWLNRITGEPGRQLFKRSIKPLASPTCSWRWLSYYGIDADDTTTRNAFVSELPDQLRRITSA